MSSFSSQARALPVAAHGPASRATAPWTKVFRTLVAWIISQRRMQREMKELMALDDRMLADIGLTAEQVEHVRRSRLSFTALNKFVRM
jgi:uncharacterized protein YjiS (DUF1127 family)